MLVLNRRVCQEIHIGDNIRVTVVAIRGNKQVRIGIEAPPGIPIGRQEVVALKRTREVTAGNARLLTRLRACLERGPHCRLSLRESPTRCQVFSYEDKSHSFPRSAWECRPRRSASSSGSEPRPWAIGPLAIGADGPARCDRCRGLGNDSESIGPWKSEDDAERPRRHSHAERGNEYHGFCLHGENLGSVCHPSVNRCRQALRGSDGPIPPPGLAWSWPGAASRAFEQDICILRNFQNPRFLTNET